MAAKHQQSQTGHYTREASPLAGYPALRCWLGAAHETLGFLPRHREPVAKPILNITASSSRSSAKTLLLSALASKVSSPCRYAGWSLPRRIVAGRLAPWQRHTGMPKAARFLHLSPVALHLALHRRAVPLTTLGRGMGWGFLHQVRGRRALAE